MKILLIFTVCFSILSCASLTSENDKVKITSNSDIVKGCKFLGKIKSTSGWSRSGLAGSDIGKDLQDQTAKLGGNTLFIVSSGMHALGEAYLCNKQ